MTLQYIGARRSNRVRRPRVDGRVAIAWGVYGVPETFVIDRSGRVACRHSGP